ncbi:MAG: transposase [Planctomycetota bacterium]
MARQLRIVFEGAFYHITSRGNLRDRIFFDDKDREMFLEILKKTKERYGYLLHAYALMDNHYHLLIETPKANMSQIMQNINTSYTVYTNRKHQRSGHLFQGRFKGIVVDKDEYLITLSRYIHLNPVRAGIVQRPEDYRWTSYRAYINKTQETLVDITDTLSCFSESKTKAVRLYRKFCETGIGIEENPFKDVAAGLILGSKKFKAKVMKFLGKIKAHEELPQIKRLTEQVPIDRVIKTCCSFYEKKEDDLLKRGKDKRERQIAIYLSKVLSGRKNIEVGSFFGIKGPAVSGAIKAIEGKLDKDKRLKKEIEGLRERLINE